MTSRVHVDAHAGWDMEVTVRNFDNQGKTVSVSTHTVAKLTQQDFYVHSNMEIIGIREIKAV